FATSAMYPTISARRSRGTVTSSRIVVGGTITGEHGVGLAKKAWLRRQVGEGSHDLMRELKRAWDPRGLLNPGKIFD
ncbi:MAG: FAD-linked oxidase C-terminal domain-containing protein, partial [Verrucomicrobiota bacterium]